jgi:hypothetical protein
MWIKILLVLLIAMVIPSAQGVEVVISSDGPIGVTVNGEGIDFEGSITVKAIEGELVAVRHYGQDLNDTEYKIKGHKIPISGYVINSAYKQAIPIFLEMPDNETCIEYGKRMDSGDICINYGWYSNEAYRAWLAANP